MPRYNSFFSNVNDFWGEYYSLRKKYEGAIPIPQSGAQYFKPIRSIEDMAELALRPIYMPLWLSIHTLGFLIKSILNLAISIVLAPFALILAVVAPKSGLREETSAMFKCTAAQAVVSLGIAGVALFSTAMALIFNPIHIATRVLATVIDTVNSTTESCCGLTIARL